MAEYEQSRTADASAQAVFDFVADIRNLPRYLPTTHHAEPQGPDRVRVTGEARGHPYDGDGYLRADRQAMRLEWGADEGDYAGWLQVTDRNGGGSEVRVHLSFPDGLPGAGSDAGPSETDVQQGLDAALQSICDQASGSGGKTEPPAAT